MNQGYVKQFVKDDGVCRDDALLHFPAGSDGTSEEGIAIFLGFQSQSWGTGEKGRAKKVPAPPPKKKMKEGGN